MRLVNWTRCLRGSPFGHLGTCVRAVAMLGSFRAWIATESRKIYDEDDDQLKRCLECNENGLIRCPTCCS
ncbi:glutaredoxin family protein [Actinidia rufa]|uniref:Glutaredoxin family protein n=1 Tax=Actinidia rufa TaxID=165716 RepID=A0A7J0GVB5_9ERIC|nr:glutaredoxin family protein [Actinidia rufa]